MSKTKVLVAFLVLVSMPVVMFADFREHMDRIELGVSAGVGFYVGQENPLASGTLERVQSYNAVAFGDKNTLKWPGIETFGFEAGYRFDTRWSVVAKTYRQRICFAEYDKSYPEIEKSRGVYYNAVWHVDVMGEYNILNYGNVMMPKQKVYNVVPYVGMGFGLAFFNKNAELRSSYTAGKSIGKMYPTVGWKNKEVATAIYIPIACGVKWRINDNVQLKGTFQYELYFASKSTADNLSANLDGASYNASYAQDRPKFYDMTEAVAGKNHNCLFSISAIFNLGKWYEDRLITY